MITELNKKYSFLLGSKSPRRVFLLKEAGFEFSQVRIETDEDYDDDMPIHEIAQYLSEKKAKAFSEDLKIDQLLITADTIVAFNNRVLGKPANEDEAKAMLQKLSGNQHEVYTGVCFSTSNKIKSFSKRTEVRFKNISDSEIKYYIDNFQPYDKAGAYGIQEWFGYVCVESINGSYTNVMGLPIQALCEELKTF